MITINYPLQGIYQRVFASKSKETREICALALAQAAQEIVRFHSVDYLDHTVKTPTLQVHWREHPSYWDEDRLFDIVEELWLASRCKKLVK